MTGGNTRSIDKGKVAVVCFTGRSGLTDYSVCMSRALSKYTKVTLYTAKDCPEDYDCFDFSIERVFRRTRHLLADLFRFAARIRATRPDTLYFQGPIRFPLLDMLFVLWFRKLRVECVAIVHDVLPHYPRPWSKTLFRLYYSIFDKLVLHSASANLAMDNLNRSVTRLTVPHGPYDIFKIGKFDRDTARKSFGLDRHNPTTVLFFGHLESRKGLAELVEFIASNAKAGNPGNFHFLIAGPKSHNANDKFLHRRLEQIRQEPSLTITDCRVDFREVERYFFAADVAVLPYLEGTTSGILKLALAFKLPIIVSNVGDLAEEMPIGAGIVLPAVVNPSAIGHACEAFQKNKSAFVKAMELSQSPMSWDLIALRILDQNSREMPTPCSES
ncbi:glycosyltransferase [Nostoc sp. CHAB 5824]|nr:glycosyltransferase [Nostoc sp. CHAB 5824]